MMLRNSHFLMAALILTLGATWLNAQTQVNDQRLVSYARSVDVSKLDPNLRQQRLDVWIRSLIGKTPQQWKVGDCGERIGNEAYDADPPICGIFFPVERWPRTKALGGDCHAQNGHQSAARAMARLFWRAGTGVAGSKAKLSS